MKSKHIAITFCILFLTAACSISPTIRSNYNQAVDFNQYKTFGFFQPLDTDSRYESLTSQYLKQATVIEMTQRGFVLNKNKPDLLINFHRDIESKQQINEIPITGYGGYREYRGHVYYDSWVGYRSYVDNYQEGKLNIDIVDSRTNKVIWQGEAVGRVSKEQENNLQATLQKTVSQMFTQFPASTQP
tara:strand:- start:5466 stop:6026 length:561 start_codon:yes stop_codon:yes gene_type:complete